MGLIGLITLSPYSSPTSYPPPCPLSLFPPFLPFPFHLFTFLTSFFFIFFLFITNFVQSKPILTYDCNPKTIDAYRNYSFFKRSICHWCNGRKSYKVR